MKKEIKKIVLIGLATIFASTGLFAQENPTAINTASNIQRKDSAPLATDKLIKKIEINNDSHYDVKLFVTEQKPGKTASKPKEIKVKAGKPASERVSWIGEGELITDIQYVVFVDGKEEPPVNATIAEEGAPPAAAPAQGKVTLEVTREKDKVLKIKISDTATAGSAAEAQPKVNLGTTAK